METMLMEGNVSIFIEAESFDQAVVRDIRTSLREKLGNIGVLNLDFRTSGGKNGFLCFGEIEIAENDRERVKELIEETIRSIANIKNFGVYISIRQQS